MSESEMITCPSCGKPTKPNKFCMICGAPLEAKPPPMIYPTYEKLKKTVIVNKTAISEAGVKDIAEKSKLALYGIPPKKPLFGPKPEELVALKKLEKKYENFIRAHGVYSIEYYKENSYSIKVDSDVIEVTSGNLSYTPTDGTVKIKAEERKTYKKEITVAYNNHADEVKPESLSMGEAESDPKPILSGAGIELSALEKLERTVLDLAVNVFKFRICQVPDKIGRIKQESLDIVEFAEVFTPIWHVSFEHVKTKEAKTIQVDGVTGKILTTI